MKFLFSLLLLSIPLLADVGTPLNFSLNENKEIVIHNRILLKVEGKTLSLMDVVKKMDLLFYRQFPEYAAMPELRFQYYQVNWKPILSSVIDDHLILADAKEKKVEVSDGDIRETMESLFGPEVVVNLDKLGMTYEEARELIKTELTVRKMMGAMVRSRAACDVQPKEVKKLFEKMAKTAPLDEKWVYRMLTIQTQDEEKGKSLASKALEMLSHQQVAFEHLPDALEKEGEGCQIRLSEEFKRNDRELSLQHKQVLASMAMGACSAPVMQTSKKDGTHIVRLFHLKEKEKGKELTLNEMEEKLHAELMEKAVAKYNQVYIDKLRKHYGVTESYLETMIPDDFQPFALK